MKVAGSASLLRLLTSSVTSKFGRGILFEINEPGLVLKFFPTFIKVDDAFLQQGMIGEGLRRFDAAVSGHEILKFAEHFSHAPRIDVRFDEVIPTGIVGFLFKFARIPLTDHERRHTGEESGGVVASVHKRANDEHGAASGDLAAQMMAARDMREFVRQDPE